MPLVRLPPPTLPRPNGADLAPPADLVAHLRDLAARSGGRRLLIGTDGGSDLPSHALAKTQDQDLRRATWSISTAAPGPSSAPADFTHDFKNFAGILPGASQDAFFAELWALLTILSALAVARVSAWIAVDCKPVVDLYEKAKRREIVFDPTQAAHLADISLAMAGGDHHVVWIPSHGKRQQSWRPPDGHSAKLWRELNKHADAAATDKLVTALRPVIWRVKERQQAEKWADHCLRMARLGVLTYNEQMFDRVEDVDAQRPQRHMFAPRRRPQSYRLE